MNCGKKNKNDLSEVRQVFCNEGYAKNPFRDNTISNTKYKWWNFIFKNLIEQFSRFMNLYFLLIACLQLWDTITPVNPVTTWFPLAAIFTGSALKELIDDYYRAQSDKMANRRPFTLIRNGKKTLNVPAREIRCGDILYLVEDEEIPADCVLLKTSSEGGACYIQTANLDGETDLKQRNALSATQEMDTRNVEGFRGVVECAAPNPDIYVFSSRLSLKPDPPQSESEWLALSELQTILQGTHIRNTEWVYGMVVYTGNESKIGMNKSDPPTKWTKLDQTINHTTIFIFSFQLFMIITFGILGQLWKTNNGYKMPYLAYGDEPNYQPAVIPLRFMLLMSFMIPISLKVTLDVMKLYYARLIDWDLKMYDETTGIPAVAHSTSISEDLGQTEFVFSDKTGTLTENIMQFRKCSINGVMFGESTPERRVTDALGDPALHIALNKRDAAITEFWRCLALNHKVVPKTDESGLLSYRSSSPDEEALVCAAQRLGVVFLSREKNTVVVDNLGNKENYWVLAVLEFSPQRKRMSVMVRDLQENRIKLFVKGADEMVLPRLRNGQDLTAANNHLNSFAELGLRTLVLGFRYIEEDEFEEWHRVWFKASTEVTGREEALAKAYERVEHSFELLGVTAIEDKLQDKVPETIRDLRLAGLKFWMLTGDKKATATQIAQSCNLYNPGPDSRLLHILDSATETSEHEKLASIMMCVNQHLEDVQDLVQRGIAVSVIIEGSVLKCILGAEERRRRFLELCLQCHSIICCRVTPQQKAEVVKLVKDEGHMCLAIGDGGNDVSMIQEANVGVGIAGREGLQAARAADYSFGKFKFLKRLLLVHGRLSYRRTAVIAQYCFYKSLYICLIQVFYNFFTGFSGTSFFNTFSLTLYNVIFTGLPVFGLGLDRDVPDKCILVDNPGIYRGGQENDAYNVRTFLTWFIRAVYQAAVSLLFTVGVYSLSYHHWGDGSPTCYDAVSIVTYSAVVLVNSLTVFFESHTLTVINHFLIVGTTISYFVGIAIYSSLPMFDFFQITQRMFSDVNFWATIAVITVAALLPVVIAKFLKVSYAPSMAQRMRFVALQEQRANGGVPALTDSQRARIEEGASSSELTERELNAQTSPP